MRNNHKQCNNISTISQIYHFNKCIFYGVYWVSTGVTINWKCMDMLFNVSKSISPSVVRRVIAHCTVSSSFRFNAIKIIIFQNVSRKPETLSHRKREKKNEEQCRRERMSLGLMAPWKKKWGTIFEEKNSKKTVRVRAERMRRKKRRQEVKVKKLINQF